MNHQEQIPFKLFFLTLFFLFLSLSLSFQGIAQKQYNRLFYKALVASDKKDFETAIAIYRDILEKSPDHVDAMTQLAICLVSNNASPDTALTLFYNALSIIPESDWYSDFGVELQLSMARTYKLAEKPDSALAILTRIKQKVSNRSLKKELQEEINQTRNYAVLLNNPVPLNIRNLGHELNSEYDDHSPLVSFTGNRILFTSRRPSKKDRMMYDGQHAEKVFMSDFDGKKWENPEILADLSTRNKHESILSISPDYSQLFLFKNHKGNKTIFTSRKINGEWTDPEMLPFPINSRWDETHACLSADQSTLFFTSSRPGGLGGLDIYMIKKNEFGRWGKPRNVGPNINSEKDEETPMLHPDGRTLYFSSEGHNSVGRFDIFYSQMLPDSTWTLPANMGYPINTPDDDFFFVPSLDKSRAYYASYRFVNSVGRSDLYEVVFDSTYEGSLAVIEGTIHNENNLPPEQIRILVARNSDNQQVGDYRPNPTTGKYLLFLESGESYTIRETTPYATTDSSILNISETLAYDSIKQVLMVQDSRMIPPLKPKIHTKLDSLSLAAVTLKEPEKEEVPGEIPKPNLNPKLPLETITLAEGKIINKEIINPEKQEIKNTKKDISDQVIQPEAPVETITLAQGTIINEEDINHETVETVETVEKQTDEIIIAEEAKTKATIDVNQPATDETHAKTEDGRVIPIEKTPEEISQDKTPDNSDKKYTVQILALNKYPHAQKGYFAGLDKEQITSFRGSDGFLRYVIREFDSVSEALNYRSEIQKNGRYSDAFIRPYTNPEKDDTTSEIDVPESGKLKPEEKKRTQEAYKAKDATPVSYTYTVQILALNKYPLPQEDYFKGLEQQYIISYKGTDGFLRYIIRQFDTLSEAKNYLKEIQKTGRFSDAFIRRYSDLKKLTSENKK